MVWPECLGVRSWRPLKALGGQGTAEDASPKPENGSRAPLTIHQEGPEQAQATDADVSVPGEGVRALQDVLEQLSLLQLL